MLASPSSSSGTDPLELKAKLAKSREVGVGRADTQPIAGDNMVKVRVAKPGVFQAENLATRGAGGGFEVKRSVIGGRAVG
jgi:hypothetical protein